MNVNDMINQGENANLNNEGFEETLVEDRPIKSGFSWLKTPALEKPLESYINHPLNRSKDEDFGQGIRGVEAFLGNTNLAIIDLFGFIKYFMKSRQGVKVNETESQQPTGNITEIQR